MVKWGRMTMFELSSCVQSNERQDSVRRATGFDQFR